MTERGDNVHLAATRSPTTLLHSFRDFLGRRRDVFALVVVLVLLQVPVFLLSNGLTLNDALRESGLLAGDSIADASGLDWLSITFIAAVVVCFVLGRQVWLRRLTILVASFETFLVVLFTLVLASTIGLKAQTGGRLLQDSVVVWASITLLFALWYWLLESASAQEKAAGKPHDIVFAEEALSSEASGKPWRPRIIDYVYLSFTVGTTFSPGTAIMLSRRAKLIQMLHTILTVIILLVIAARAVNIVL